MLVVRFRNSGEHEDLLKKVKKMKKFTEEIEDCLSDAMSDEEFASRRHEDYDDYDEDDEINPRGRYSYRRRGRR